MAKCAGGDIMQSVLSGVLEFTSDGNSLVYHDYEKETKKLKRRSCQ